MTIHNSGVGEGPGYSGGRIRKRKLRSGWGGGGVRGIQNWEEGGSKVFSDPHLF